MNSTLTLGCKGSFDLMVTDLECSPGAVPVSTFTLIEPALPGERTLGKSTAVHPQLGSTAAMLSGALPALRIVIVRAKLLLCGCLPKSILVVGTTSFGEGPVTSCPAAAIVGGAVSTLAPSAGATAGWPEGAAGGVEASELAGTVPFCATGELAAVLLLAGSGGLEQAAINATSTRGAIWTFLKALFIARII